MSQNKPYPKSVVIGAVVLVLFFGTVIFLSATGLDKIDIEESFAQNKVSEMLPIEKDFRVLMTDAHMSVTDVEVLFLEDGLVSLVADADVQTKAGDASIQLSTIGTPVYKSGAFYFHSTEFEFTKFEFSQGAMENVARAGTVAKNAATKFLGDLLEDTDIEITSDKMSAAIKDKAQGLVEGSVISYLSSHPIKKLEGNTAGLVSLALNDIEVNNKVMTIHFSLLQFTGYIILLIVVSIACVAALLTAPWWAQGLFLAAAVVDIS